MNMRINLMSSVAHAPELGTGTASVPAPAKVLPDTRPEASKDNGPGVPVVTAMSSKASDMAALADTPDINDDIHETLDAGEKTKRGALVLLGHFQRRYGDRMAEFPRIGSDKDSKPKDWQDNQPYVYDLFDVTEVNKDGASVLKKNGGSYYKVFVRDLPEAKGHDKVLGILDHLELIDQAKEDRKAGKDNANNPYSGHDNPQDLDTQRKTWAQRLTALEALVKKTISLHHQKQDADRMPKIMVKYATNKDGTMSSSTVPIMLLDNSDAPTSWTKWRNLSVVQFLAFDLAKAMEAGGTYEAVIASASRAPKKKPRKGTVLPITDVAMFEGYAAEVAAFIGDKDNRAALLTALADKENEGFVETIGDTYEALAATKGMWIARYTKLKTKDVQQAEADAAKVA